LEESLARARRVSAAFEADPLKARSMSPTATGAAAANRLFDEVETLYQRACPEA
jgi:hypothetical protein